MKKFIERLWKKEEGFTLIELIIVIAILAIISAIAIPNIMGAVDDSRKSADQSNAAKIAQAVILSRVDNDSYSSESGYYIITDGTIDGVSQGFADDILAQLNNDKPEPAYGAGITATDFTAFISTGGIQVYATNASFNGTVTTATAIEVYPNANGIYE